MGAWAKDPMPGAAAGALDLGPGRWTLARGEPPRRRQAQGLSPMRPWAMASCSVLLYYYTLILYYYIIFRLDDENPTFRLDDENPTCRLVDENPTFRLDDEKPNISTSQNHSFGPEMGPYGSPQAHTLSGRSPTLPDNFYIPLGRQN